MCNHRIGWEEEEEWQAWRDARGKGGGGKGYVKGCNVVIIVISPLAIDNEVMDLIQGMQGNLIGLYSVCLLHPTERRLGILQAVNNHPAGMMPR